MDLKSGYPFPLVKNGLPYEYPRLENDLHTEVAVLGGGISGALTAFHLAEAGVDCVVLDARTIGLGSTCASTSLLQYEIDIPLHRLSALIGEARATAAYRLCAASIYGLRDVAEKIGLHDFTLRHSVYYAKTKKDTAPLRREYAARKNAGFDVSFLGPEALKKQYGFDAPGAIVSGLAAETDAYLMTHALHRHLLKKGGRVYDRTKAARVEHTKAGVSIRTENGYRVQAKKVVYATGYEVTEMLEKNIVKLHTTYVTVSEPLSAKQPLWKDGALIWNTGSPYLYMRTAPGRRIIVGGRDDADNHPARREKRTPSKTKKLVADFNRLFPDTAFVPEFSWAGTFGSTKDGLPYIGTYAKYPHGYFSLGFGGNGITFSQIGAEMIRDLYLGKPDRHLPLFSFDR